MLGKVGVRREGYTIFEGRVSTDHFGGVAREYASARPTYPAELFAWLAKCCPARVLAWDVGAGSGQASVALAEHFERILATDLSAAQLKEAVSHPRVEYREAPAHESGLGDGAVDLVAVAQALHWFDVDRFYAEVRRVLKPEGVIAAWTYGVLHVVGDAVEERVQHYYKNVVGPYWPEERRHVENGYASLPFPFRGLTPPAFQIHRSWTLEDLLAYCRSWSASARYKVANGSDAVEVLESDLAPLWGGSEKRRSVTWPITLCAGTLRE